MNSDIEILKGLLRHSGVNTETDTSVEEIMKKLNGGYSDAEIQALSESKQKEIAAENLQTLKPSELLKIADRLNEFNLPDVEDVSGAVFSQMTVEQRQGWADEQIKVLEAGARDVGLEADSKFVLQGFANTLNNGRLQSLLEGQPYYYSMQLHLISALSREHPNLSENGLSLSPEEMAIADLESLIKRADVDSIDNGTDISVNPVLSNLDAAVGIIASNAPASEVIGSLEELKRNLQVTVGAAPNKKVSAFIDLIQGNIDSLQPSDKAWRKTPIENFKELVEVGGKFGIILSQRRNTNRQSVTCTERDGSLVSAFNACNALVDASPNGGLSAEEGKNTAIFFPAGEPPDPTKLQSGLNLLVR